MTEIELDSPAWPEAQARIRQTDRKAEIEIDDDIYEALNVPAEYRDPVVETELAISLYDRGILSFGTARALTDRSKREFHRLLGYREIERHYTAAELDKDIEYARR